MVHVFIVNGIIRAAVGTQSVDPSYINADVYFRESTCAVWSSVSTSSSSPAPASLAEVAGR